MRPTVPRRARRPRSLPWSAFPVRIGAVPASPPQRARSSRGCHRVRFRATEPLLQLAQHRVVSGDGYRLREGRRRQGRRRAEGDRRNACAGKSRSRQSEGRCLVGGRGRLVSAGRRGRVARDVRVTECQGPAPLGATDIDVVGQSRVGRIRRHPCARLQHRARREEEAAAAQMLEGPVRSGVQGRADARQSHSSGTAYLMLATLVQVFGEDEAFKYMKAVHPNVSSYARSGIGPMTAVKRGEIAIGSTVLHGVINDIVAGFPVLPVLPCEGVGYEVGSIAIVKGARNLDNANRFVDWALTVEAQKVGLDVKEYAIPTNHSV